jgi:branched-chain amino acid aminotransferase
MGIPCEQRRVDRTELLVADEVFLCGTAAELSPITSIDHIMIGNGAVGTITKQLAVEYIRAVSNDIAELADWSFPIY